MRDNATIFSDAQAITATAASTNVLDLTDANHQIGQAVHRPYVVVVVNTAFAGSLTSMDIALQDSADNSTFADTEVKLSTALKAKLTAGTLLMKVPIPQTGGVGQLAGQLGAPPPGPSPIRRYVRMYYTLNGGAASAGKIDAWIDTD